jgi:hypothetical protein
MAVKVDKELMNQLAAADDGTVEAVVKLKPAGTQIVSPPERTEKLTKRVLDRTSKKSGQEPQRYNVFRNLGSFVVAAKPGFIRELISQPEVSAVIANQQPGSAVIAPVKKRAVSSAQPKQQQSGPSKSARKKSTKKPTKSQKRSG